MNALIQMFRLNCDFQLPISASTDESISIPPYPLSLSLSLSPCHPVAVPAPGPMRIEMEIEVTEGRGRHLGWIVGTSKVSLPKETARKEKGIRSPVDQCDELFGLVRWLDASLCLHLVSRHRLPIRPSSPSPLSMILADGRVADQRKRRASERPTPRSRRRDRDITDLCREGLEVRSRWETDRPT